MAPLLLMGQMVGGQTFTTQTITTLITNPQTGSVTVGTSIVASTVLKSQVIFSAPVTIPPTHGVCGIYFMQPFNATAGSLVSGTLIADNKIDFYLMTDMTFQAWSRQLVAGGNCTPGSHVVFHQGTAFYKFTTTIPANGSYYIVVNNLSHSTVKMGLTATLTVNVPVFVTKVMYSTVSELTSTVQTLTLTTLATAVPQGSSLDTFTLLVGALVAVVIIVAAVSVRAKRGRGGST